jgi:PAS domain S-box-containing protein
LQLDSRQVTPGFSGAPVYDEVTKRVVGMVVAITPPDEYQRLGTTAFAIPPETIREICPELQISDICPYRSLDVFNEEDAPFFFGRERVVQKMIDSLKREPRFLAVLGPSGSGKSSVVRAGLIPALRQGKVPNSDKWGVITIRPANQPFDQLDNAGFTKSKKRLEKAVRAWLEINSEKTRLVLIIDQFEELLVSTPEVIRQKFIKDLANLLGLSVAITVVLTLRDDFYSRFLQDATVFTSWLEHGLVNIPTTLDEDELKAMIVEPAKTAGLNFEEGLVDVVIRDAVQADRTKEQARSTILPLLEFALTQLWERQVGGQLTRDAYHIVGGVSGGLSQWADRIYYSLTEDERIAARRVLTKLVNIGDEAQGVPDTRRIDEFNVIVRNEKDRTVAQKLVKARLMIVGYDNILKRDVAEIIHEALFHNWSLLSRWLWEDREYLHIYHQFVETAKEWERNKFDEGLLYRGSRLVQLVHWLEKHSDESLSSTERGFLDASTKRQEIELQMEKSISAQGTILEAIYDGIVVADSNNLITFANQSIERILDLSNNQLTGQNLKSLTGLYGGDTQAVLNLIRNWSLHTNLDKTERSYSQQMKLDNQKTVLVYLSPVIWQKDFLGTISIFRDITSETEAERIKSEFVASVSHELRTPATSIRGYADVLLMGAAGALNENQAHFVKIIKSNTERLNILVNDLLDVSRIEAGRVTLSPQALDLRELAEDVIEDVLRHSKEENKPMAVSLDAPKKLPSVYGDPERVRQILANLVFNAYHYTPENGTITVCIHKLNVSNEIQVDVKDNGVGILPEDQSRVFERFYRGEHPLVLATPGTGLGLSIVKQIVEMHHGRTWVKSTGVPGEGSIFSFTLPIDKST